MDPLTITVIGTAILAVCIPVDGYVAWRFYSAWKGGESIRYFAPLMALIVAVAVATTACFVVGLSAIQARATGTGFLPLGVGIIVIACAIVVPSAIIAWLGVLLRRGES